LDEALGAACSALGVRVGELTYEVEEESAEGVVIRAGVDSEAVLGLFLAEVFRAGELELEARIVPENGVLAGELSGEDIRVLTGGEGRGLDALQYLCNRVLDHRVREHAPVHLDCGGFKGRRSGRLEERAARTADEVARSGRAATLPPMTPAARRDVHLALAEDSRVETESDGSGFLKRVVVRPRRRR
jgi:predicted RNA-binding protein Jag